MVSAKIFERQQQQKPCRDGIKLSRIFLFNLFSDVWQMLGETVKVPRGHRKFQVLRKFNFAAEVHLVKEKIIK